MPVSAGQLRHRVTLQEKQDSRGDYGEVITDWADVADVWAQVAPQSGKEYIASQAVQSEVTTRITIRYRDDVDASMRVAYRGKLYNIHAVLPDAGSGLDHLSLMCSEGVNDG